MKSASIAALVLIVGGVDLRAQVVLTGAVRDSGGRPVIGAEVSIAALQKSAIADSSGHYSIDGVTPGMRLIQVRRVGFAPFSKMMRIDGSATVDYVLAALAVKLDTVRTTEQYRSTDIQMMEFLDNKKLGLGKFFTRDDLEKMNGRPLAEAFMQLPGIVIINGVLGGSKAWIASSRVRSMRVEEVVLEDLQCLELDSRRPDRCRGYEDTSPYKAAWKTLCFPDVYLDFTMLSRYEVPNVSRFSTDQLEAVEIYRSAAELPQRYISGRSACGAVVFHARRQK